jgi:hypothetical protein
MKCLLADFQLRAHRLDRGTLVELGFRPDQLDNDLLRRVSLPRH